MSYQNVQHMIDNLYATQRVCAWTLSAELQLLATNCPQQEFFFNLFSVSRCPSAILSHFAERTDPVIVTDKVGFVWIAIRKPEDGENALPINYVLGPVFTSEMTQQYLDRHLPKTGASMETSGKLWQFISEVPILTSDRAAFIASMFHFSVTEEPILSKDIQFWVEPLDTEEVQWGDTSWHGTWLHEQRLFNSIREGRILETNATGGNVGRIGNGDPLRQAKNEMIIFSVICSRASILGGVSSEGAYNLSDYFLQKIESATTVADVQSAASEMYHVYVQRVAQARANSGYSHVVRSCLDYVETHILERITLREMSAEIGYHENYISRSFKREVGKSLFDYINQRKVENARGILVSNRVSLGELSAELGFSSPSYFCAVFKKETGMTPMEYQQQHMRFIDVKEKS